MLSEIFCAVVACTGNNPKKDCGQRYGKEISILHKTVDFESITVSMTIEAKNSVRTFEDILIMPSTLNVGMLPLQLNQYKFSSTTSGRSVPHSFSNDHRVTLTNIFTLTEAKQM